MPRARNFPRGGRQSFVNRLLTFAAGNRRGKTGGNFGCKTDGGKYRLAMGWRERASVYSSRAYRAKRFRYERKYYCPVHYR